MKKPRSIAWLILAAATALVPFAAVRADDSDAERIDVLAEEIRKIKENMAIPETDAEMTSYGGLGPAASKVYRVTSGLSLGGYGEFYYQAPTRNTGAVATGDAAPVRVETAAGRRAYVAEQARLAEAAAPVRAALLDAYDAFFLERARRSGG